MHTRELSHIIVSPPGCSLASSNANVMVLKSCAYFRHRNQYAGVNRRVGCGATTTALVCCSCYVSFRVLYRSYLFQTLETTERRPANRAGHASSSHNGALKAH